MPVDKARKKEYMREYDRKNRELLRQKARERYHKRVADPAGREKERARARAQYSRDRELTKARNLSQRARRNARTNWRYANEPGFKENQIANSIARRWKILPEEREAFKAMYGQPCFYCGAVAKTIDHLIPRSRGGEDRLYNLVPCCLPCNCSKNNRTPEEWYANEKAPRQKHG